MPGDGPFDVTLFHTNDIHGGFLPAPASWRPDRAEVGGVVALARHLAHERRTAAPVMVMVDAGDFMTGNPVTALSDDGVIGTAMAALLGDFPYDAGVVGNHEFDTGSANVVRLAARFPYPLLAADLVDTAGAPLVRTEPVVVEREGLKIGIMGVSCASLRDLCAESRLVDVVLRDQVPVLRAQLADLVPRTDLQILITHDGVDGDRDLAHRLADTGLDVIVGGHSHTRLEEPLDVDGILVVQAGSNLKNLGRLDLALDDGHVTRYRGALIELTADSTVGPAPEPLIAAVEHDEAAIQETYGKSVGELAVPWRRNSQGESNLGDWLCDRLRERAGAEVAFVNSGGIRRGLEPGPITLLDIYEMLPFANALVVLDMGGGDLRTIARANAQAALDRSYGILQVSGLTYAYRELDGRAELVDVRVGGRPLQDGQTYRVALPDYVAQMRHVYLADVALPPYREVGGTLYDAIVAALADTRGPVRSEIEGRMRQVETAD